MESIGAYQAKTHLAELLQRVTEGERFIITKHGVPVAVLQPFDQEKRVDVTAVIEDIHQFRTKIKLDGLSLQEMISEGRR